MLVVVAEPRQRGWDCPEASVRASGQLRLWDRWRSGQAGAKGLSSVWGSGSAEAPRGSCRGWISMEERRGEVSDGLPARPKLRH